MPSREATFISRIANHSKTHQTWFSRQPNRILPNTELWRKAREKNGKHNIPLRVGVLSLAREVTRQRQRQRQREMRRSAAEDEPIAGSRIDPLSSSLSFLSLFLFLGTKSVTGVVSWERRRGKEASHWPWHLFTGNIDILGSGESDPRQLGELRHGSFMFT